MNYNKTKNWQCNNLKQNNINKKIIDRHFGNLHQHTKKNIIDYRIDNRICHNYTNNNSHLDVNFNEVKINGEFFPGNKNPIDFFKLIDNDSDIKNLGIYNSYCKKNRSQVKSRAPIVTKITKNPIKCNLFNQSNMWNNTSKRRYIINK
uniref:Uncharacterized protein n=1 Tax=viral metagenome TaxID=1070528 RepID=A0A6C0IY70_9ZZZZ